MQCGAMYSETVNPPSFVANTFVSSAAQDFWKSIESAKQQASTPETRKEETVKLLTDIVTNMEKAFKELDNGYYSVEDPVFEKVLCKQALSEIYTGKVKAQLEAIDTEEVRTLRKKLQELVN